MYYIRYDLFIQKQFYDKLYNVVNYRVVDKKCVQCGVNFAAPPAAQLKNRRRSGSGANFFKNSGAGASTRIK